MASHPAPPSVERKDDAAHVHAVCWCQPAQAFSFRQPLFRELTVEGRTKGTSISSSVAFWRAPDGAAMAAAVPVSIGCSGAFFAAPRALVVRTMFCRISDVDTR